MMIKPLGERVLLEPKVEGEKTAGGIYIPESAREKKKEGVVVAVGAFSDGKEIPLVSGDKVIYSGYSADEISFEGKDYVMVEFKDVIGKVE